MHPSKNMIRVNKVCLKLCTYAALPMILIALKAVSRNLASSIAIVVVFGQQDKKENRMFLLLVLLLNAVVVCTNVEVCIQHADIQGPSQCPF